MNPKRIVAMCKEKIDMSTLCAIFLAKVLDASNYEIREHEGSFHIIFVQLCQGMSVVLISTAKIITL